MLRTIVLAAGSRALSFLWPSAALALSLTLAGVGARPAPTQARTGVAGDSTEVQRLCAADQMDRTPPPGGRRRTPSEWQALGKRDRARLARLRVIYAAGELATPEDIFCAAMIFQHSIDSTQAATDYLLAHELAITAALAGVADARYLVAASEDRFLESIGRRQRFGTQWGPDITGKLAPDSVDGLVTDWLRAQWGVPTLARLQQSPGGR